jgi:flagellar basal-body rod protein FlgB
MELFDTTYKALNAALGAAGQRHEVIANNIANVNTPGFKRSDVQFQDALAAAVDGADSSGNSSALDSFKPAVAQDQTTSMRADGNNVDVDVEMANLAENNVQYNALVQLAAKKLKSLEYVISDGRR